MKLITKWLLSAASLLLVAYLYSGVEIKSYSAALIAALVIGLFNTVLRPILVILTLPVTVVTLGLFLFVINALMFWSAAGILDGFTVAGFIPCWASLLTQRSSACSRTNCSTCRVRVSMMDASKWSTAVPCLRTQSWAVLKRANAAG